MTDRVAACFPEKPMLLSPFLPAPVTKRNPCFGLPCMPLDIWQAPSCVSHPLSTRDLSSSPQSNHRHHHRRRRGGKSIVRAGRLAALFVLLARSGKGLAQVLEFKKETEARLAGYSAGRPPDSKRRSLLACPKRRVQKQKSAALSDGAEGC